MVLKNLVTLTHSAAFIALVIALMLMPLAQPAGFHLEDCMISNPTTCT